MGPNMNNKWSIFKIWTVFYVQLADIGFDTLNVYFSSHLPDIWRFELKTCFRNSAKIKVQVG